MRKTFDFDRKLLKEAQAACGALTETETLHRGLQALIHHEASQRLRALGGSEPDATDVPRRREEFVKKSKREARKSR